MITQIILDGHHQKKCFEIANAEGALAIAHDDDLKVIKHNDLVRPNKKAEPRAGSYSNSCTKETLTADAVLKSLRENKIPVLIENGGK